MNNLDRSGLEAPGPKENVRLEAFMEERVHHIFRKGDSSQKGPNTAGKEIATRCAVRSSYPNNSTSCLHADGSAQNKEN